ncbi:MAG TPA: acetyl-CoA carboxylase biotin carboxyl carrier protein [Candidatus Angelobacter sp.]|nr:acetyl-CoA carboxylase biotin carboxyl carrier protein [Candidatus Angelobacter sp.]
MKELIDFLIDRNISEFELERGDVKVRVKRGTDAQVSVVAHPAQLLPVAATPAVVPVAAIPAPAPPPAAPEAPPAAEEALHVVKSPIVGTFYEAPAPGAPPFVKPGDEVQAGQVLCIIEAMKLMNEIESDVAGEIVKRLAANNQPVEYGQPLFAIRPRK